MSIKFTPKRLRWIYNIYPPYVAAGIRVEHIGERFESLSVRMTLRPYNRNFVGTHFGGSLYSMVDPHMMLLLMNRLGRDYVVWDQAATIRFKKPGRGTVRADFLLPDEEVAQIARDAESGAPIRPEWNVEIKDEAGDVVAEVHKVLYVRKKSAVDSRST